MAKKKVSKKTVSPAKAVKELEKETKVVEKEAAKIEKEVAAATVVTKEVTPAQDKAIDKELDAFFEDIDAPAKAPVKEIGGSSSTPSKASKKEEIKPKAKVAKAVPIVKSEAVVRFDKLVDRYREAVADAVPGRSAALTMFIAIMDYVVASNNREIFDAFYDFFIANRKGILANTVVLNGIARLQPQKRNRVGAFYTLFMAVARYKLDGLGHSPDIGAIRVLLNNDALANYVAMMTR